MIIYDIQFLKNFAILSHSENWRAGQLISESQCDAIGKQYPVDWYTPNIFISVILFLATILAVSAGLGLVSLLFGLQSQTGWGVLCLLNGALVYTALENVIIKQKKYYRAGVDAALLYIAIGSYWGGLSTLVSTLSTSIPADIYLLIGLPVLAWGVIRFADGMIAVALYICFFALVFLRLVDLGTIGKSILPFVVMLLSAPIYVCANRMLDKAGFAPWANALKIFRIGSLLTFYLGGNYLVVRELTLALLGLKLNPGADIPLALIFYILTVTVPVLYLLWGIKKHDIMIIRIALLTAAFSIYTFRHYYAIISYEFAITIAGGLLILLAVLISKYLKKAVNGFTSQNLLGISGEKLDFEALLVAASVATPGSTKPDDNLFQGGKSGGAGAEGQY